jgi:hypothetical protein
MVRAVQREADVRLMPVALPWVVIAGGCTQPEAVSDCHDLGVHEGAGANDDDARLVAMGSSAERTGEDVAAYTVAQLACVSNEKEPMGNTAMRLWLIGSAGAAGGFLALLTAVASLPARVLLAVVGGAFVGLALYFHGRLARSS